MATYKTYKLKDDKTEYWEFSAYLGTDKKTGKRVRVNRRKDRNNRPFYKKKEAELEVARLQLEFEEGTYFNPSDMLFKELYEEWVEMRYKDTVKESTLSTTKRLMKTHVLERIGNIRIDRFSKRVTEQFIRELTNGNYKNYEVFIQYVRRVFAYAVHMDYLNENPVEKAYIPPKKKSPKRKVPFFNKEELAQFLKYANTYGVNFGTNTMWGVLFHFLAFTGCRKGEALALKWTDIDFDGKKVSFNRTLSESIIDGKYTTVEHDTTKNGTHRDVTLDTATIRKLKEWKHSQALWLERMNFPSISKNQLVFSSWSNNWIPRSSPNDAMKVIAQRAGVGKKKVSPHGLRHTHASLLFEAGRTLKEVQERLGHESSDITLEIYTHVTENKQEETAEAFKEYISI